MVYIQTVRHKQEKRNRMVNLLQEKVEIESHRTFYTFIFCRHTKYQPKKNKRVKSSPRSLDVYQTLFTLKNGVLNIY